MNIDSNERKRVAEITHSEHTFKGLRVRLDQVLCINMWTTILMFRLMESDSKFDFSLSSEFYNTCKIRNNEKTKRRWDITIKTPEMRIRKPWEVAFLYPTTKPASVCYPGQFSETNR